MLNVIVLSVTIFYCYAECHYVECRHAECRHAKSRGATSTIFIKVFLEIVIFKHIH